jgi:hypothetical protein
MEMLGFDHIPRVAIVEHVIPERKTYQMIYFQNVPGYCSDLFGTMMHGNEEESRAHRV